MNGGWWMRSAVVHGLLSVAVAASAVLAFSCKRSPASVSGPELFASTCARCHGADGSGGTPGFGGAPGPRNLRDHAFQESRADLQLRTVIVNGKGGMPAFGTMFNPAQLDALVAHVRSFDSEKPK